MREIAAATRAEPDAAPADDNPGVVTATGELVALVESELVARQPGRIGRILVDEGSAVTAGQPLLELESDYFELEARAAAAEEARAAAALREAERELERETALLETKAVARADYDRTLATWEQAHAAHALASARLELARQQLDDAVLRSPIAGVVAERRVDVGERLQATTVAFVLVQARPLKLRFQLPERYLPAVRRGSPVRAFFDPYPGEVFRGEVSMVGQVIDPASRSLEVEALLPNRDRRLRPGLFARVEMELQRPPGGIEGGELQSTEGDDAQIR